MMQKRLFVLCLILAALSTLQVATQMERGCVPAPDVRREVNTPYSSIGSAHAMAPHLAASSYGQLFEENASGTAITVATAGTWYNWISAEQHVCGISSGGSTITTSIGNPSRMTVGSAGSGLYIVGYFACVKGENAAEVRSGMLKNGTLVSCSEKVIAARASAAAIMEMSAVGIGNFAANDTLQLAFTSDTNADVVTVYYVNHFMIRIGP